jgi:ABC-2 type transport system permease protein
LARTSARGFQGSAYIALGLYISWLTRDQITAFSAELSRLSFCLPARLPAGAAILWADLKNCSDSLSVSWHADSLAAGLLDTRDLLYYLSRSRRLFLFLNKSQHSKTSDGAHEWILKHQLWKL